MAKDTITVGSGSTEAEAPAEEKKPLREEEIDNDTVLKVGGPLAQVLVDKGVISRIDVITAFEKKS